MDVHRIIASERRQLAADLASLTPAQWATTSLVPEWTIHDVVAHLTLPLTVSVPGTLAAIIRGRGSVGRSIAVMTARRAALPSEQLLRDLDEKAESRFAPPGLGPSAPLTDVLVHGEDIRRPLGLERAAPAEAWHRALGFLTSGRAVGFVPRSRTQGLAIEATDVEGRWGSGATLRGPAPALALALTGRPEGFADLDGDGVALLRSRLDRGAESTG